MGSLGCQARVGVPAASVLLTSLPCENFLRMGSKNGKPVLREEDLAALVTSSGKQESEVKEAFEAFVAEHPNGKMKPKDFRNIMSSALPKKDASKMEKHVSRIYDANNDGYVDFVEFMVLHNHVGRLRRGSSHQTVPLV